MPPRHDAAQKALPLGDEHEVAIPPGLRFVRGHLNGPAQRSLLEAVLAAVGETGWFTPTMPGSGRPLSVRMANLGPLGWVADSKGYRYQPHHPETGQPWPAIPAAVLAIWNALAGYPHPPECCLVNHYRPQARMGMHQDRDESAGTAPVVSISLGDQAVFRIGGATRRGPTVSMILRSGDVVVMGGAARRSFHGIDRILAGTSDLVPGGGRINLTLRRVTIPCEGVPS